jgi:tetratricopeptide (TPR) repeat protein
MDPPLRVQLLIALAMTGFYGNRERSLSATEQAMSVAASLGKASLVCASLLARAEALGWTERHAERLECIREAFRLASRGSVRPIVHGRAMQQMAAERLDAGDRRGFENYLTQLEGLSSEHRLSYFEWSIASMRGAQAIFEGRYADGRSLIKKQFELGTHSNPKLSMQVAGMQHMFIELATGDPATVATTMKSFVDQNPDISPWRAALAVALAESGQFEDATRHVEALIESDLQPRHKDFLGVVLAGLAETIQLIDSAELAETVSNELDRQQEDCVVVGICLAYYGALDRYRGLCAETLGNIDEAVRLYEQGVSVDRAMKAHPYVARGLHDLGRALDRRGTSSDRERARRELQGALEMAKKLGMRSLAGRILDQQVLQSAG